NDNREVKRIFESSLSARLGGVAVTFASLKPHVDPNQIQAMVEFSANGFGQLMQNRLLVASPGAIVPGNDYILSERTRVHPLKIRARSRRNTVRLKIPAGFAPDEIPEPVRVSAQYGSYEANWAVKDGEMIFEQSVRYRDLTVPAADYQKVKSFFDEFAGAQSSAVVLMRKN
ncbi:MAG: hypothetical protein ACRD7E_28115, partial [Bryobacteraceae bacterium]